MAARYDISADQGATFEHQVEWRTASSDAAIPLTDYEARMQVRSTVKAVGTLLSLTSNPSAGLLIDADNGAILITVSAEDMAALPAGMHAYDLEVESPAGVVTRLLTGEFTVKPEVTR